MAGAAGSGRTLRLTFARGRADIARIVAFSLKAMRDTAVGSCKDGGEAVAAMRAQLVMTKPFNPGVLVRQIRKLVLTGEVDPSLE
jgi:hypothetical protein